MALPSARDEKTVGFADSSVPAMLALVSVTLGGRRSGNELFCSVFAMRPGHTEKRHDSPAAAYSADQAQFTIARRRSRPRGFNYTKIYHCRQMGSTNEWLQTSPFSLFRSYEMDPCSSPKACRRCAKNVAEEVSSAIIPVAGLCWRPRNRSPA
jgi:hypothetical protein